MSSHPWIVPAAAGLRLAALAIAVLAFVVGCRGAPALAQTTEPDAGPSFRTVPIEPGASTGTGDTGASDAGGRIGELRVPSASPLRVGVVERPPYATRTDAGWTGIAVDGWRLAAERLGRTDYEWVPVDAGKGLAALANGAVDLVLPIDVTADAPPAISFTIPFHTATLGVAGAGSNGPLAVLGRLLTWEFVRIVLAICVLLFVVGAIVWRLERGRNDMFGGTTSEGLGDGFWWAGVTLTTIGYGDKTPITAAGRAVAMLWMLAGLAISSALTAAIVSATGLGEAQTALPEELRGRTVVVPSESVAGRFLDATSIPHEVTDDIDAALRRVADGRLDAVVAATPLLRERVGALGLDVRVSRSEREPHLVALARRSDDESGSAIDRAVIATVATPAWGDLVARYLGD